MMQPVSIGDECSDRYEATSLIGGGIVFSYVHYTKLRDVWTE